MVRRAGRRRGGRTRFARRTGAGAGAWCSSASPSPASPTTLFWCDASSSYRDTKPCVPRKLRLLSCATTLHVIMHAGSIAIICIYITRWITCYTFSRKNCNTLALLLQGMGSSRADQQTGGCAAKPNISHNLRSSYMVRMNLQLSARCRQQSKADFLIFFKSD